MLSLGNPRNSFLTIFSLKHSKHLRKLCLLIYFIRHIHISPSYLPFSSLKKKCQLIFCTVPLLQVLYLRGQVKAHSVIVTTYPLQEINSGWYQQMKYVHWDMQFPPRICIILLSHRSRAKVSVIYGVRAIFHKGKMSFRPSSISIMLVLKILAFYLVLFVCL